MNTTALKIGVPITIATLLTASQVNAQHTFSGFVYDAANGVSSDSALVQLVSPLNNDTITTKVSRTSPKYWNKTSQPGWINDDGDTAKTIVTDTTGQQARTFIITEGGGDYVHALFPGGHAFLVKKVWGSVDSVDAKCYSIGPTVWSDTLEGRFRILPVIIHDEIYFDREKFQNPPALNDSFVIEVSEGSLYAETKGQYKREFWDVDKAPNCSLQIVGVEENLEKKIHKPLIIKPNPATNYITFGKQFKGFLYDASGKKVLSINSDRLDLRKADISSGIYFVVPDKYKLQEPKKVTIIR